MALSFSKPRRSGEIPGRVQRRITDGAVKLGVFHDIRGTACFASAKDKRTGKFSRSRDPKPVQHLSHDLPAFRFRTVAGGLVGNFVDLDTVPDAAEPDLTGSQYFPANRAGHMLRAAVSDPQLLVGIDHESGAGAQPLRGAWVRTLPATRRHLHWTESGGNSPAGADASIQQAQRTGSGVQV